MLCATNESPVVRGVQFSVKVNIASPFLMLEVKNSVAEKTDSYSSERGAVAGSGNSGWFSENNFHAEAEQVYRLSC